VRRPEAPSGGSRGAQRPLVAEGAHGLVVCGLVILLMLGCVQAVHAHELSPDQLASVGFDQRLGQSVPRDLAFLDDRGQPVTLGQYFQDGPVGLTLNQLHCKNLCPVELEGLIDGLNGVPFALGQQFTLLTVSIDARETPEDAATAKARGLRGYVGKQGSTGWHVLTGDQASIDRLEQAVGFNAVYDPEEDEFAHPAGVVLLTPTGQISRYIYGIDFSSSDLRLGLTEAGNGSVGSFVDRALLVCYHYDPLTGRYTPLVVGLMQGGAAAGVLGLGGLLAWLIYRGRS
jgi:protein SCO1